MTAAVTATWCEPAPSALDDPAPVHAANGHLRTLSRDRSGPTDHMVQSSCRVRTEGVGLAIGPDSARPQDLVDFVGGRLGRCKSLYINRLKSAAYSEIVAISLAVISGLFLRMWSGDTSKET